MEWRVIGSAERAAQIEWHPQGARGSDLFGVEPYQAYLRRRDPGCFEVMCQPAHGARAQGSDGREQYRVDPVLFQQRREVLDRRRHLFRIGRAHERIMIIGDRIDVAFGR